MSKHETPKRAHNSLRRQIATGGLIAVAAFAGGTQPASAKTAKAEKAPAPTALTSGEQALNVKAQSAVTNLAGRILGTSTGGTSAEQAPPTYMLDSQGNQLASQTINIAAETRYGSNEGEFSFTVIAPSSPDGDVQLNDVQSVVLSEGTVVDASGDLDPYVTLGFNKNPVTDAWEVAGDYQSFKGPDTSISAGIKSVSTTMPHLSASQLGAAVSQAESMIESSSQTQPMVTYLMPAFNQAGDTVTAPSN